MSEKEKINWDLIMRDIYTLICDIQEQIQYEKENPKPKKEFTKEKFSIADYTDTQWRQEQEYLNFNTKHGFD